ncbi:MAG: hypothetical protein IVW36_11360 [Dehalococcoidia bacterium]|nr:hypothetical protein [Dehalococcoidia bacterium]
MKRVLVAATALVLALAGALSGSLFSAPSAQANPTNVITFNPTICLALAGATAAGLNCQQARQGTALDYTTTFGDQNLTTTADGLGNNNGVIEPGDFTGVQTFSGGQIHQSDGGLIIVAFVASDAPVTVKTTAGVFVENNAATVTCNSAPLAATGNGNDPDCGGGPSNLPAPYGEDHLVAFSLACSLTSCPTLGKFYFTVEQDGIVFPVPFTVVGEPRTVKFFTLEQAVQAGVPVNGALSAASAALACPFSASLSFVTKALGQAEKTVIVARAADISGTTITGAWFNWSIDNNGTPTSATFPPAVGGPTFFGPEGIMAQPTTPTLDLGGFGLGAPNILCVPQGAAPGKVTVRATLGKTVQGLAVDPGSDPGAVNLAYGDVSFNVVGQPANLALTASPASIACDGTATATVSAAITDAAGTPALSGTEVHFSSPIVATANPLDTTTNDKGLATSVISPLAGTKSGVPVTVSVYAGGVLQPNLTQQILVQCSGAAPPPGGGPAGAPGGTPPGGSPAGVSTGPRGITGPNTGTGPLPASGSGSLSWWPALALVAGALLLGGSRLALRSRRSGHDA